MLNNSDLSSEIRDHIECIIYSSSGPIGIVGTNYNNDLLKVKIQEINGYPISKNERISSNIKQKIMHLPFPHDWLSEGVKKPNSAVKEKAFQITHKLFIDNDLIPDKILPSKEDGVFLCYNSNTFSRSLVIEIYNDLDVAMLIRDNANKKILYSNDDMEDAFNAANILNE